jgi:hypothetical protein
MFMVFKPYDLVMAIPMEYYVVMCLNLDDWCPHTLQTMFMHLTIFSSKYDIFNFTGAKIG